MNTTKRTWIAAVAGLGIAVVGLPMGTVAVAGTAPYAVPASATTALTDDELVEMREEERFAGDVYTALATTTGQRVFTRIATSEDRHQSAVEGLLRTRGVDVTELPSAAGDYAVDSFDTLYDQFLAQGAESRAAAYRVGVTIETTDIEDLTALLARDLTAQEEQVFGALLAGSQHHLDAFQTLLDGGTSPRAGSPERDQVGPRTSGPRQGQQQGMGQGQHPRGHRAQAGTPGTGGCPYLADGSGRSPRR